MNRPVNQPVDQPVDQPVNRPVHQPGPGGPESARAEAVTPATVAVTLTVNGLTVSGTVHPATTLLEFLREDLQLTGTKRGCDLGECGCCTVLIDGRPQLACLKPVLDAEGHAITTIEGVSAGPALNPVQQAFVDHGALQCGFCTPAMVLNASHLLAQEPDPGKDQVRAAIAGTICRCTGYGRIETAILGAARHLRAVRAGSTHGGGQGKPAAGGGR